MSHVALVSTDSDDDSINSAAAFSHQRSANISFGNIRKNGVPWVAGWNYISSYNWSVGNWESVGGEKKRKMRGEPILLNRMVLIIILGLSVCVCVVNSPENANKYFMLVTIFFGLVIVVNTIWNWYVFLTNGNRVHPERMFYVSDSLLNRTNEFYGIPIHTTITDRHTLVMINRLGISVAQLIQQNQSSTTVRIMVYGNRYLSKIGFRIESFVVFLLGVALVGGPCYFLIAPLF